MRGLGPNVVSVYSEDDDLLMEPLHGDLSQAQADSSSKLMTLRQVRSSGLNLG